MVPGCEVLRSEVVSYVVFWEGWGEEKFMSNLRLHWDMRGFQQDPHLGVSCRAVVSVPPRGPVF